MYDQLPIEIIVAEIYPYLATHDIIRARRVAKKALLAAKLYIKGRDLAIDGYPGLDDLQIFNGCKSLEINGHIVGMDGPQEEVSPPSVTMRPKASCPSYGPMFPIRVYCRIPYSKWPHNITFHCYHCRYDFPNCDCKWIRFENVNFRPFTITLGQ
jgi:hypothetical protein